MAMLRALELLTDSTPSGDTQTPAPEDTPAEGFVGTQWARPEKALGGAQPGRVGQPRDAAPTVDSWAANAGSTTLSAEWETPSDRIRTFFMGKLSEGDLPKS